LRRRSRRTILIPKRWPATVPCYGALLRQTAPPDQVGLRCVDGRPVSAVTTPFLDCWCAPLEQHGVPVWTLIGDHASWQVRTQVRTSIRAHNRTGKQQQHGVRILVCYLPVKSPWRNPIEPKWVHGQRASVAPARLLAAHEVAERVCGYFHCSHEDHLIQEKAG
jgi:hypothetical protein